MPESRWVRFWRNRWAQVSAVALGVFVINGLARLISRLTDHHDGPAATYDVIQSSTDNVVAVVGILGVVALMGVAGGYWAVRHPLGRVAGDLGLAVLGGAVLAMIVAPFIGGNTPFQDGAESFVIDFLEFLAISVIGVFVGFSVMVVLGKEWKTRGLAAYAERYGKRPHGAITTRKR
ncbi:MAG TPA: hypothetical protein VH561_07730 [Micromonosporaceae bacterium]|jgi:predicted membrane protein